MTFQEQLIFLRKQKGLSQEQLGEKIGVSRQTISKWELGSTTPEMEKLIQLSDFFDIPIDTLVGRHVSEQQDTRKNVCCRCSWHYEYKSKRKFRGIPLIHINVGRGLYHAKGIVAIGTIARGLVSIGVISMGLFSFGAVSLGLLCFGAISLGLLFSVGSISLGIISIGGLAVGILAIGGCSIGIYSIGGCAVASHIAAGGYANAPIAIGDKTVGQITFDIHQSVSSQQVQSAILQKYPHTWKYIIDLFSSII
ncbi:helix-turn-helix transcriptional regulator [Massilioclostridium coli]|uniref:helix-turn-helix transcriptional regulator n=1 Tax=Massilioclostridium coli TaxID=1870991 RepID=UPI00085C17B3|nr:helix-turn-helix transcriptional regulator [Massilioclostridium coli]